MDLLKLLTEESIQYGITASEDALAAIIATIADVDFESYQLIKGGRRPAIIFFYEDCEVGDDEVQKLPEYWNADAVSRQHTELWQPLYDPPQNPDPAHYAAGWEVRGVEVNHAMAAIILPAWVEDRV